MLVKVRRDGNLLAVSGLTEKVGRLLENELHYTKMVQLRGEAQRKAGGARQRFDRVRLYEYDGERLITNFGFLDRVTAAIKSAGFSVDYKDVRPRDTEASQRLTPFTDRLSQFEFRYRQDEVIRHVMEQENGVFVCPTGYGKSFIIRVIATLYPYAQVDVITKSADVIRGFYDDLVTILPDVGLQGAGKRINGSRVQLYCAGSLGHSPFTADIVLVDEGHELATEGYLPWLAKYRFSKMFMFTASYNMRLDKADKELEGLFGPVRVEVSYADGVKHKMIVPIRVRWIPVLMDEDPGEGYENVARERWAIWRNKTRNALIAEEARKFGPDEQVLIVCEKVEHIVRLKKLLPEFTLCYGETGLPEDARFRYVRDGFLPKDEPVMNPYRRNWLKDEFGAGRLKKVIATSVWNRGVDFRQLSVLIRADASGSPINDVQIPGRVSRLYSDKDEGLIIDFMDQFNPGYKARAKKRRTNYEDYGWIQEFPETKPMSMRSQMLF